MASITKEQVVEYLRGLINAYGPSPSITEAAMYARSSSSSVGPADAIYIFGANGWDGVMAKYYSYLASIEPPAPKPKPAPVTAVLKSPPKEEPKPKVVPLEDFMPTELGDRLESIRYYPRERCLEILLDMYVAFKGHFTAQKVRDYSKRNPVPPYAVLYNYFGPPKDWAEVVESETTPNK